MVTEDDQVVKGEESSQFEPGARGTGGSDFVDQHEFVVFRACPVTTDARAAGSAARARARHMRDVLAEAVGEPELVDQCRGGVRDPRAFELTRDGSRDFDGRERCACIRVHRPADAIDPPAAQGSRGQAGLEGFRAAEDAKGGQFLRQQLSWTHG